MGKKVTIMPGERYGRLTVIAETKERESNGNIKYLCRCDCGNVRTFSGYSLRAGIAKSCGCYNRDVIRKFGNAVYKERLYGIWTSMRNRCNRENDPAYHNYGGRGIKVCKEWEHDYRAFKKWAYENGYGQGLWIDRIDNDGDYCPENCAWKTPKEQERNKRTNIMLTINGKTQCLTSWAEEFGIKPCTLKRRIDLGWPTSDLSKPVDMTRSHGEQIKKAMASMDGSRVLYDKGNPRTEIEIEEG